jgi:hypothetical protein
MEVTMAKNDLSERSQEDRDASLNKPAEEPKNPGPPAQKQRPKSLTTKDQNGNEIPFTPAPRSHATESMAFLGARGQEQFRKRENPGIPQASTPEAKASAKWQPMPAGGIAALADSLFPEDRDNPEAMHEHVFDLMLLNNDLIRDDTSHSVGQQVRVPG